MGKWTEADKTSMVMPAGGLISGLTVVAGGIAGIVLGTQANEREDGSGTTTLAAGITALIAGTATATAGIIAMCRKIAEVMARDDGDDIDHGALGQNHDALSAIHDGLQQDATVVRNMVDANKSI
jgi:hypothetical protein